jgi:hypothetical protein
MNVSWESSGQMETAVDKHKANFRDPLPWNYLPLQNYVLAVTVEGHER